MNGADSDPTNEDRAAWAQQALAAFGQVTGQRDAEYLTEPDMIEEITGDLIADLLHLVAQAGLEPEQILAAATELFEIELAEDSCD
jgi:hypothetical protein